MRIPENETGLPLVDAVKQATGRRPHLSTVLRWCQRPNRYGIRLESWRIGVERVRAYNERTTAAADSEHGIPASTPRQQTAAHAAAVRDLDNEYT
jgi:hypothetical protein